MCKLNSMWLAFCLMQQLCPVFGNPAKNLSVKEKLNGDVFLVDTLGKNGTLLAGSLSTMTHKSPGIHMPSTLKPYDVKIPENTSSIEPLTPAAQNYFTTYYQPHSPPLGHSRPYYQPTEEPFLTKYLAQPHKKQYLQRNRPQTYNNYDTGLMGSGDFGVLRGGTFYSNEDSSYHQEDNTEFYYGEASDTQDGSVTEGFIQKYTYPEEQFAQFRDFADLNAPEDAAFSKYVVVYAAQNSTQAIARPDRKMPNNIFDQLQQIDEENAMEAKKHKTTAKGLSSTKMKLIKTKIIKKKLNYKAKKSMDEDPLVAVS